MSWRTGRDFSRPILWFCWYVFFTLRFHNNVEKEYKFCTCIFDLFKFLILFQSVVQKHKMQQVAKVRFSNNLLYVTCTNFQTAKLNNDIYSNTSHFAPYLPSILTSLTTPLFIFLNMCIWRCVQKEV